MKIAPLSPALEPKFWEHVNQDIPHYFFFALDWKHNRNDTKILLALKENRIDGMMLIFKKRIVQLRGSRKSAKALLERLVLKKAELQASKQHEKSVLEKYTPTWSMHAFTRARNFSTGVQQRFHRTQCPTRLGHV